jgi:hypothetical protein
VVTEQGLGQPEPELELELEAIQADLEAMQLVALAYFSLAGVELLAAS